MGAFSFWHIAVVVLLVVVLFGKGKISGLMGDLAGGIKAFKKGMADEPAPRVADARPAEPSAARGDRPSA